MNKFLVLISSIIIGLAIYLTMKSSREYKTVREKGKSTICEVTTRGSDIICYFKINGRNVSNRESKPYPDIRSGESFRVYYYDKIPDRYYVCFYEPVYDISDFTEIKANMVEKYTSSDEIRFEYTVDSTTYLRYQYVNDFDENKTYRVYYKNTDPRIAYIKI